MKAEQFEDILYQKEEETGIVTVTMNTPRRKNALSACSFLELWWAVDIFQKDETAHAMILTGAKDPNDPDPTREAFSSGAAFDPNATKDLPPELLDQIDPTDIALNQSIGSEDFVEAVTARIQKRDPVYKGG